MMVILAQYFFWHYLIAPRELLQLGRNYQISVWHRFLIGRHFATLIAPWHRMSAMIASAHPSIKTRIEAFFLEPILRFIGLLIRLTVICWGLALEVCVTLTIVLSLVLWIVWPALLIAGVAGGFRIIIGTL